MNIVLVHGILGFRQRFDVEYFRGVAEHLRVQGIAVLVPELDPTQGIEFRGNQLCDQINAGFNGGTLDRDQKTHIVAHSMGGLDSRYVLSPVSGKRLVAPVRSLTTISTPHLGSPIADLINKPLDLLPFLHLPFGAKGNPLELALNELGISLEGLRDLTADRCQAFSAKYGNSPTVDYFSVAGSGRDGFAPTASALLLFHHYIFALTGQPKRWSGYGRCGDLGNIRSGNVARRPRRKRWDTTWTTSFLLPHSPISPSTIRSSKTWRPFENTSGEVG